LPLVWTARNYVVNQAIQQYLAYHHVLHQKIEQGLNDVKEGKLTTADDVMKEIRSRRAQVIPPENSCDRQ
jgi:predicted transcriptional regulator